jgi:uncharacterized protein (TIGR02246 family)
VKVPKPTDDLQSQLLDREAIRSLPQWYAHAVWQGDGDAFADLFADDGVIEKSGLGLSGTITGRTRLRANITEAIADRKPRPLVHNHVFELADATHATGYAYVEVLDGRAGYQRDAVAHYRDEYVKIGGEWNFQRRDVTLVWAREVFARQQRGLR